MGGPVIVSQPAAVEQVKTVQESEFQNYGAGTAINRDELYNRNQPSEIANVDVWRRQDQLGIQKASLAVFEDAMSQFQARRPSTLVFQTAAERFATSILPDVSVGEFAEAAASHAVARVYDETPGVDGSAKAQMAAAAAEDARNKASGIAGALHSEHQQAEAMALQAQERPTPGLPPSDRAQLLAQQLAAAAEQTPGQALTHDPISSAQALEQQRLERQRRDEIDKMFDRMLSPTGLIVGTMVAGAIARAMSPEAQREAERTAARQELVSTQDRRMQATGEHQRLAADLETAVQLVKHHKDRYVDAAGARASLEHLRDDIQAYRNREYHLATVV